MTPLSAASGPLVAPPSPPDGDISIAAALGVRSDDTVGRLLVAAAEAIAHHGYSATTTRDIAGRAGLSPAGVYVHFPSKEVLLYELSSRGHIFARDMLVAAAAASDSPTKALRALIGGFSRWHAEHHELGRIVQYEFRHLSAEHQEHVRGLRREIDKVVRDVLIEGVAAGEFEVDDVAATAVALLSMAVDVARWYLPQARRSPETIEAEYGALALRLVRPSGR